MKGVSHVKEHRRHVVDRADRRASGGTEASEHKGASRSASQLGSASRGSNESGQSPIEDKPEPPEKNDAETLRRALRAGRRQRVPKERLGTWETL
jgi:hypothetical protein